MANRSTADKPETAATPTPPAAGATGATGADVIAQASAAVAQLGQERNTRVQGLAKPQQPNRKAPAVDPVVQGARTARAIIEQEEELRRRRQNTVPRYEDGSRKPEQAARPIVPRRRRPERHDQTGIYGKDGKPVGTPGMIHRWVRENNADDRKTSARVGEHLADGFRFIKDPQTGEPVRSESGFGVAMECDPDDYAQRVIDRSPEGALSRNQLLGGVYDAMEQMNRAADDDVVKLVDRAGGREYSREAIEDSEEA